MISLIRKLYQNQTLRYIFFGGCTTLVNLVTYSLLRNISITTAGFVSVLLSIVFAFVVNKLFVFQSKTHKVIDTLREAFNFFKMRFLTMLIEVFGVVLLTAIWGINDLVGKFIIQFVVLVLNYIFSRLFVFKDKNTMPLELDPEAADIKKKRKRLVIAAGAFSMLFLEIGFALAGVFPFGDRSILIIDSAHQYLPFFTEYLRKIKDGESLLYTFGSGMGMNFWALFAYYLASPLNFLLNFFSEDYVMEAMMIIVLIKIGLSGGFFAYYLNTKVKKVNLLVIPFGVMFALSNFMIGYYFNIMWLDSIMVLPLVMLGIERLVREKRGGLYCGTLTIAIFCNYYIGFMVCMFSCCYFLIQLIAKRRQRIKEILVECGMFGIYSLLAGGMSAIVLLPAYKALTLTQSVTDGSFPTEFKTYTDWFSQLTQHMAFVEPITISDSRGDLNVYCGVFAVVLLILYLLDRHISFRERIAKVVMCIFLFVSFNVNVLNYIWHDFHTQNGLPNRFAFLYIALLLSMGFEVCLHIKKLHLAKIVIACLIPIGAVVLAMVFGIGEQEMYVYGLTLVLLNVYMWLVILYRLDILKRKRFRVVLTVILLVETAANGIYGTLSNGTIGRNAYLTSKNEYQEMIERQEDDSFYRSEMDQTLIRNEILYQGGRGLVTFSSTVPYNTIHMQIQLGMEGRMNKSGYGGTTRLVNDIFGVKYLASRTNASSLYGFEKIDEEDSLALYYNEQALSLGFMVDSTIVNWDIENGTAMDVQNDFIEKATGMNALYSLRESYTLSEDRTFTFTLAAGEQVYLDIDREVESITVTTPEYEKNLTKYTNHLYDLGCYEEDTEVTVEILLKDNGYDLDVSLYSYMREDYQPIYEELAKNQLEIEEYSSVYIKGSIHVDEAGTLLLTVPYEDGWTVKVNESEAETFAIGTALTGLDLEAGDYTIEMSYTSPGLWSGTAVTLLCGIAYILFLFFAERRINKRTAVSG